MDYSKLKALLKSSLWLTAVASLANQIILTIPTLIVIGLFVACFIDNREQYTAYATFTHLPGK